MRILRQNKDCDENTALQLQGTRGPAGRVTMAAAGRGAGEARSRCTVPKISCTDVERGLIASGPAGDPVPRPAPIATSSSKFI